MFPVREAWEQLEVWQAGKENYWVIIEHLIFAKGAQCLSPCSTDCAEVVWERLLSNPSHVSLPVEGCVHIALLYITFFLRGCKSVLFFKQLPKAFYLTRESD